MPTFSTAFVQKKIKTEGNAKIGCRWGKVGLKIANAPFHRKTGRPGLKISIMKQFLSYCVYLASTLA